MSNHKPYIDDQSDSSGVIFGVLDPLSNEFTGYRKLPVRNNSSYNCFYVAQRAGRLYVLKGLAPAVADDPVFQEWLAKEFQIGIQLDHHNIVRINSFEDDPRVGKCIVMEYVDGLNLTDWLAKNPSVRQRKEVFRQLMAAVSYCHDKQIWHRDLKPSNILITNADHTVKLIDLGLADSSQHTFMKQSAGTRKFAAPEQLQGLPADHRADIYALGGILKLLFPHRYRRAVCRAQRVNPEKRPQSVAQFAKLMRPRWMLWLLPLVLVGFFLLWMRPSGEMFPVTLDGGQTVYAKELSNWHRTVALVPPNTTLQPWENRKQPSGDLVIPSHIRHRLIPYRVTDIDPCTFASCDSLLHLTLPEGLQRIGDKAFHECIRLCDTVVFPSTLRVLETYSFADCFSLSTIVWKSSDCKTGDHEYSAFNRCNSLKTVIVDSEVKTLPPEIFNQLFWVEDVQLPNTLRELPKDFISYSYNLCHIRLPDSLEVIHHAAFYSSGLKDIVIPDNTGHIEGYAFSYCDSLRTVDIGRGIRTIKSYAFNKNKNLESVTIRSEEPPMLSPNALYELPANTVLYVPAAALEKYRNHPDWQVFGRIEALDDVPTLSSK